MVGQGGSNPARPVKRRGSRSSYTPEWYTPCRNRPSFGQLIEAGFLLCPLQLTLHRGGVVRRKG